MLLKDLKFKQLDHQLKGMLKHLRVGYPPFRDVEVEHFLKYHMVQFGDPYSEDQQSNYGLPSFEKEVMDYFSDLWNIPRNQSWGYLAGGSSEAIMFAMISAR
jgi:histidine decarboxylase